MAVAGFIFMHMPCSLCVEEMGSAVKTFLEWTPDLSQTNDTPWSKNLSEPQVPYRWNGETYFSRHEEILIQCTESAASSEALAVGTFHNVLSGCGRSGSPKRRRSPRIPLLPRPSVVCRTKTEHFKKNPLKRSTGPSKLLWMATFIRPIVSINKSKKCIISLI